MDLNKNQYNSTEAFSPKMSDFKSTDWFKKISQND